MIHSNNDSIDLFHTFLTLDLPFSLLDYVGVLQYINILQNIRCNIHVLIWQNNIIAAQNNTHIVGA